MKAYKPIVGTIAQTIAARSILDSPCGAGWLTRLVPAADIDGIDLFAQKPAGYRNFLIADLEDGIPDILGQYDMIVSCEGLEHIANPGLFLKSAFRHLNDNGTIVITTPNTWHPAARVKYFSRGFFPGFPSLAGKIKSGSHMHIMPWSWPHLYLHLTLAGFTSVELHPCGDDESSNFFERLLAQPMKSYCRAKKRKASCSEEKRYWEIAASDGSLYAHRLVVSAKKVQNF